MSTTVDKEREWLREALREIGKACPSGRVNEEQAEAAFLRIRQVLKSVEK